MKNIVIAAGYATRLGELTSNFPKPLLKIGNKSILKRMLNDIDQIPEITEHVIISIRSPFSRVVKRDALSEAYYHH
ncbi:sugar phosphate nucleotidyltransferase [Prevotella sp.]|uniref:sugar phosphate nucleotidyltransferase n=1 Tax=Prevotella sp. TaxID=59823 RepID=UPI002F951B26